MIPIINNSINETFYNFIVVKLSGRLLMDIWHPAINIKGVFRKTTGKCHINILMKTVSGVTSKRGAKDTKRHSNVPIHRQQLENNSYLGLYIAS